MIRGIIFDNDGILFDTEPCYCKASIQAFANHGISLSEKEYYDLWTRKGHNLKMFLQSKKLLDKMEIIRKERFALLSSIINENLPLISGVEETLKILHKKYPLALVTSSRKENLDLLLNPSGIAKYFKTIITVEDVKHGKPDPEGFLLASKKMKISPQNLLVIEDAEKGIIAAHKAGMKSLAIPTICTKDNDFSLATMTIEKISELKPEFIMSL